MVVNVSHARRNRCAIFFSSKGERTFCLICKIRAKVKSCITYFYFLSSRPRIVTYVGLVRNENIILKGKMMYNNLHGYERCGQC